MALTKAHEDLLLPVTVGTLADAANIAWDVDLYIVAKVTLGGDRILDAPTNGIAGQTYLLEVWQDGTGSRLLTYDSNIKWGAGEPVLATTATTGMNIFSFYYDGGFWRAFEGHVSA